MKQLLSDNPRDMASAIRNEIISDRGSAAKRHARQGVDYYNFRQDILKNRIFFIDDNGDLREDKYASNVRIPHSFLNELIDQKVQFMLSKPVEVETQDAELKEYLTEYYNEDMQLMLQELVEGGSQKGFEYAYARTTAADKLTFQVADSLRVIPIYDDNNDVVRILRYYSETIVEKGQTHKLWHAEVYDNEQVWYFTAKDDAAYELDKGHAVNPAPHVLAVNDEAVIDDEPQYAARNYGRIPFYRYSNNRDETTDLQPIKALIDDYDLMDAFLSNNLQDFAEAIYVVKGFQGDDLSKLRQNVKAKKTVGVGENGGLDIQTINIPVEARRTKLELDRENIYKFGFGFDSSQVGDGNVTNVVLKGRYTLLNMKANKAEVRLRAFLAWANDLIIDDINRRYGKAYKASDVSVSFTREMLVNENDIVANEKVAAETRSVEMQTLLAVAPRLDDETVLKQIASEYDLDYEEIQKRLETQAYEETPVPNDLVGGEDDGAEA